MVKYKKILLLGSGGLRIGQAGEFDYSGSQAIKAFKQEGIKVVLVNPNIATVQTDPGMADTLYLQPLNIETVTKIIQKEKPDAIALSFGGQTALNLGLALEEQGILKKYNVKVLGTPVDTIRLTEDRELFKQALQKIDVHTPKSFAVTTVAEAVQAGKKLAFPLMLRSGFSLGGLGSGKVSDLTELQEKAHEALNAAPQILIEEYLAGWKEIEYEIVRDCADNVITVCNMENFDPMGVHTGESIVVAPSQTLTNQEYHLLREVAIKVARSVGIVGECNIQYALNPKTSEYRVIEMNARLSRSSALASKATGYPLAFVAAKLALGYRLDELKNAVTKQTSAFFEPALDYLALKMPRWDIGKFKGAEKRIGTEMKSVGEVMALGRSFPEVLQKAVRMLNIGVTGLHDYPYEIENPKDEIENPTFRRLFALSEFFTNNGSVEEAQKLSKIDPWFLHHVNSIGAMEKMLRTKKLSPELLREAKKLGFSDKAIGQFQKKSEKEIRKFRLQKKITPVIKQIDTLAGEFPAKTNYLYTTYHGSEHDVSPSKKSTLVIGSGPYCIGSSVEFDWCAVNTARTLRKHKKSTIIINSNPETVSTDYDESDRLYFEELTLERVSDIADFEKLEGIIVSVGGQIGNSLARPLAESGYTLLGTPAASIDIAEDRKKFSSLLQSLKIDQPEWEEVTTLDKAKAFATRVAYPILVRPSYVLSGAAMNVLFDEKDLEKYLREATVVSKDHPVVISKFMENAKELEVDGVAKNGEIILEAISEHIEHAGVHSGDATLVLPPQRLYMETIRRAKRLARKIVRALHITGPFNIQFLAKDNWLKIIECNARASRSFPFVSKVTNNNFIEVATLALLGKNTAAFSHRDTLDLDYVAVKTPQFSYSRLKGANPIASVEMASTGEVACISDNFFEAFFLSWLSTEQKVNGKKILISLNKEKREKFLEPIKKLDAQGWDIYTTEGTHDFLAAHGIGSTCQFKMSEGQEPNVGSLIQEKKVDVIINIPSHNKSEAQTDGSKIRRLAIDHHIPLLTNARTAHVFLQCLTTLDIPKLPVVSWQEYMNS